MDSRKGWNPIRRIALRIQYDGTSYSGWQIQNNGTTVQSTLTDAFEVLTGEKVVITASGRTDSGVHALGQVAHLDTSSELDLKRICLGLNGILPKDISVENCYHVPHDFHARYDPVEREYQYLIYNHPYRTPFMLYRAMWVPQSVDIDLWNRALGVLVGEHDFASFCKKISTDKGTVRKLLSARAEKRENYITVTIKGYAFLHNMIRIIIGSLAHMSAKSLDEQWYREVLAARDRDAAGPTAPPFGLYLSNVVYDPPLGSYSSAI